MGGLTKESVLNTVTECYLKSSAFKGMSIWTLLEEFKQDWISFKSIIRELIEDEMVGLIDVNSDQNPSINRTGFEPKDIQISKLDSDLPLDGYIYPSQKHLHSIVNPKDYEGQPYKLCLALGEKQLAYSSFELSVLEYYRNDPRYKYKNDDIRGYIYYDEEKLKNRGKILLQSFGFSYDDDYNRAVAVFLFYLKDFTPEHQQIWKGKELQGNYKLHPDYYRNTVLGDWGEKEPICSAFLKELYIINQMAKAMGRPPLFDDDYGKEGERRPKLFGFLIRPTLEEFERFIHLFDKMLSDNINKDFSQNEVPYEDEIQRNDSKIQVQQKSTLRILDDWIREAFRTRDWEPWDESIETLRKIRKMRQKPAHKVSEDQFDQKYFKKQREIIVDAYSAVRNLRLLFANHPKVKKASIDIPDWLQDGKIWTI
jgi:hypothetical protein